MVNLSYNVDMKTKITVNPLGIKLIGLVLFYILRVFVSLASLYWYISFLVLNFDCLCNHLLNFKQILRLVPHSGRF